MTTTGTRKAVAASPAALWTLLIVDAALLATSGAIHLNLWPDYKHVHILGPLFLLQVIAAFVIALAVLVTRHVLAVAAGLALVLGTILGFILVITTGLFGFKLPFVSGEAYTTLVVEIVAVITLAVTARLLLARRTGRH
jgi:hypothetical protein